MLVKMQRHPDFAHLSPASADVDPSEVESFKAHGWIVSDETEQEAPKRGRPRKAESE